MIQLDRRTSISLFSIFVIIISSSPVAMTATNYWTVDPGWGFVPDNSGPVLFNSTAYFDEYYFQNGSAYFRDPLFSGDYPWGVIGFNCSDNSNMTLVKLDRKQIKYIVNAPTANISTTKIKLPLDREPSNVIGATNYTYNNTLLIVNVTHSSPVIITVEWETLFQVLVKALTSLIPIENATVTLSNPSAGTIVWAYYTNSTGYTPEGDLDIGNYSLNVFKEDYQPYTLLFEFTDNSTLEVLLKTIEEGVAIPGWNILTLVFLIFIGLLIMSRRR